jgi:hypothetical protein
VRSLSNKNTSVAGEDVSASTNKVISLVSLGNGMPGLTVACGTMLAQSAAVCLEERKHLSGVSLRLNGMKSEGFEVQWDVVDEQQRRCYNDLQEATERGAYGIAILLLKELTGKVVVERSKKGPGFDYWLGDADDDLLFVGKARLEVSGILSGTLGQIAARVSQKKEQITPSDELAPGYIAVVEFGNPAAHVELK